MTTDSTGQAGELTDVVITSAMVAAGATTLVAEVEKVDPFARVPFGPYSAKIIAEAVYLAMQKAKASR